MFNILTGGPCCGKSTQIAALAKLGYRTLPEASSQLIQEGRKHPLKCLLDFQHEVWQRQAAQEAAALKLNGFAEPIFLDRGLLDGIAYLLVCGHQVPDFMHEIDTSHYSAAFILPTLSTWVDDGIRFESTAESRSIAAEIAKVYQEMDVATYLVPSLPIVEVTDFILQRLHE